MATTTKAKTARTSKTKKAAVKKSAAKKATKKVTKKTLRKVTKKATKKATRKTFKQKVAAVRKPSDSPRPPARQPLGHLLLEKKLRDAGFKGGVSTDKAILDKYSYDESIFCVRPQVVLQPKDQRDVEVAVSLIAKETKQFSALSLTPRAAGTGLSGGSLTDSVVIDVCQHMHHITSINPKAKTPTFTCEPGVMWRVVEKRLKKHDLYLPSYPASKDLCSVGGAVGNNAAGPDSLRFGHCADWVESMNVTLYDGATYTIKPLTYKELKALVKKDNAHATIARDVFALLEKNEKAIADAQPKTKKNSAGYALWHVLDVSVAQFKKGHGTFDLTRLISGSQGTIGIITSLTMRVEPIVTETDLIVVPVFDLMDAGQVITRALKYEPVNVELFDGLTFDLALQNPTFFKDRLSVIDFYKVMFAMYSTYHVRWSRRIPEFTILVTIDRETTDTASKAIVNDLKQHHGKRARLVTNRTEHEMFWQIRRASYTLSKFQDSQKRPAAFLEDMTVPPENLSKFFVEIKKLLKKYNVTAAVHGHGGNGHLHFYPLLDFTNKTTPKLVEKMSEEFFSTAVKFNGNICGEHNDGIIRTPHLSKMFSKKILDLFAAVEHICDPDDIFNPGKKVNPRFDVKDSMREVN